MTVSLTPQLQNYQQRVQAMRQSSAIDYPAHVHLETLARLATLRKIGYAELKPLKLVQLAQRESILELAKQGQIGQNSLIYVAMRKSAEDAGFRLPIQGYYAGAISSDAATAWKTLR